MRRLGFLIAALAVAAAVTATVLATNGSAKTSAVVKTSHNRLVTRGGLTLYSLSAERNGRFICTTSACLALWKPLVVAPGAKPTGASNLSVVKRPDGKRQVAFRGAPVYRFAEDEKPGDVEGNGFKDVGVWRPVTISAAKAPAAPARRPSYGY